jgi:hypothetical protein
MITKDAGMQIAEGASDLGRDARAEICGALRALANALRSI